MRKYLVCFVLLPVLMWAETITLVSISPRPARMDEGNYRILVNQVIYNLHDVNDILNNVYLPVNTAVDWANAIINEINRTNTNITIVRGRAVTPRRIAPLRVAAFSAAFFRALSNHVRFQQALDITVAHTPTASTVRLTWHQVLGAPRPAQRTITVPHALITNTGALNTLMKEEIITLFNQWDRYHYQPEVRGRVTLRLTPAAPRNLQIVSLPGIVFRPGQNDLPIGTYPILIMADGHLPLFTNVTIGFQPVTLALRLAAVRTVVGAPEERPRGHLFLNADFPNAHFFILEDGIRGQTPFFATNIPSGRKTVVFEETANYRLRQLTFNLEPNIVNMQSVSLSRKGTSFIIRSPHEGATVIINRRRVGVVQNGVFETQITPGLNLITVIRDGHIPFRTNVTFRDEQLTLSVDLAPRPIPGLLVSLPERGLTVMVDGRRRYRTPSVVNLTETPRLGIEFIGTNMGYMNVMTNVEWSASRFNVVLAQMTPIFGDLRIMSQPDDVYIAINDAPRGKTIPGGLLLTMLSARTATVRLEREGYKTLTTNFFVLPNMVNTLNVRLREAPGRLFISTVPERGFRSYVNDDFVGYSGASVFSVEMGNISLKLNKRGFRTIVTNLVIDSRDTKIFTFSTSPGVGEEDVMDSSRFFLQEAMDLANQNKFFASSSNFALALSTLHGSEYSQFPRIVQLADEIRQQKQEFGENILVADLYLDVSTNHERFVREAERGDLTNAVTNIKALVRTIDQSRLTNALLIELRRQIRQSYAKYAWRSIESEVVRLTIVGDTASQNENFNDAIRHYNQALNMIQEIDALENETLSNTFVDIQMKRQAAMTRRDEKELAGDARALIDTITPMIYEADRRAEHGEFAAASRIYEQVLARIDASLFRDHAVIQEQRSRVTRRHKHTQQRRREGEVWWPKMVRNWSGVSLSMLYTGIEPQAFTFSPTGMNHMLRAQLGIHPLPLLQLSLGGLYNITPRGYAPYALAVGAGVRVPILAQWSLFFETQVLWSDFIVFDIAKYDVMDIGMDLKFGWFGLKVAYTIGWQDYFRSSKHGISAGLTFWFTEE